MKLLLVAFAALATTALAVPVIPGGTCALQCDAVNTFAYQTGLSYVYDYAVETSSALVGTFEDDAKLRATGHVHIDIAAPCEYILRVTDVNLEGSAHTGAFAEALTKFPLKFSFKDGMIESICSDVAEPTWVLNLKRGFLSAFQNNMHHSGDEDLREKDVSGVCETHYHAVTEGNVIDVVRTKELTSCSQRPDFSSLITSSTYDVASPIQNIPLLMTTNKCTQKIQDNILIAAACEETYKTRPIRDETGGLFTTVKTAMNLLSQEPVEEMPHFEFRRHSLVFEDNPHDPHMHQLEKVEQLLAELEVASMDEVHRETPALFSKLIGALKTLEYTHLSEIYASVTEPHKHKFLFDAIPLVGTPASTALVKDLIVAGEATELEIDIWFTSLAFYKSPTVEMISVIADLLESHPSQKALLGSSALINTYCHSHLTCEAEPVIIRVIELVEGKLGAGCHATNDEEKANILVALKALGNAGHWVNAKSILEACYHEENDMEIRLAALDAWRHAPCEYDHSDILATFQNEALDPELRIGAYLALVHCPTPSLAEIVKERLMSEGNNQVGSFIWTHVTNLKESAAPEKQWIHDLIGDELLHKEFDTNALRFSRNYESSFFLKELNVGASVESNVIFSSHSYLPRSAMLDLTLDLFGESINFLEIGGRFEGFEAYIEHFFGPDGYFPEEHITQALMNLKSEATAEAAAEQKGSYYLRVFGKELHYHHFHGLESLIMSPGASSPLDMLMDLFRKGEVDYTKSFQIADAHMHIPTISGFPIDLDTKITGVLGLKMNGNFEAESLTNFHLEGHLHPSAAVEVDTHMVIDAHVAETGVKMSSTLHTSPFLDGKVHIADGKVIDIAINSPKDKVEILDVKGEYFYLIDDQEVKKDVATQEEFARCTPGLLGVALCGSVKYTPHTENGPLFPLSGPFGADIHLEKTGTQTGYTFHFMHEADKAELVLDTPGSETDHKISVILAKGETSMNVDVHTPFKSGQGHVEYVWTDLEKKMKVVLTMETGEVYAAETGLLKAVEDGVTYEPSLILTFPVGEILNVHGMIKRKEMELSTKIDMSYLWGETQTIHLELEAMKTHEETANTYTLHAGFEPTQFADLKASVDVTFIEEEHKHYKAKVEGVVKGETYLLDAELSEVEAKAHVKLPEHEAAIAGKLVENGVELEGKWDEQIVSAMVHYTWGETKSISVSVQTPFPGFEKHEAAIAGKLVENGFELEGKLDEQIVSAMVHYTWDETKSISVSVHTPFPGFEKQDVKLSVTLKEHEIESRFVATWQNTQELVLNVAGKYEPGALDADISFSSTLPTLEQLALKLHHHMPGDGTTQSSLSFQSSLTENLLISLNNALAESDLTSTIEARYGEREATAVLSGHLVPEDATLNLKVNSPSGTIPEVIANIHFKFDGAHLELLTEGSIGEEKAMLNVNGELSVGDATKFTGDVRLITPFTEPITATLALTHDAHAFECKLEMTRFWADYDNVKVHAQGTFVSLEEVHLMADISSPATKASLALNHKVTDTNMESALEIHFNEERIALSIKGLLDMPHAVGNLEVHITSTFSAIHDVKLLIETLKNEAERVSKIVLIVNEHSITVDHILAFTDIMKWKNAFKLHATLGGLNYGGHIDLRTKVPYEVDIGFTAADKDIGHFHIRTDSAFLSVLA